MKTVPASDASFPIGMTIANLIAIIAFAGRGVASLFTGQFRVPFSSIVLGADQPFLFYGSSAALILIGIACAYYQYEMVAAWKNGTKV